MKRFLTLLLLLSCVSVSASRKLNIVFIGNSITQGAFVEEPDKGAPPAVTSAILRDKGFDVQFVNCGVGGSTSVDQLPEYNTIFKKVRQSADNFAKQEGELIFSIMIGTNDSAISGPNGSPVNPTQYLINLRSLTDKLFELYPKCRIIIHYPIWYSPNTYNSAMYLKAGLERLISYRPMIDRLVAENPNIFVGDTLAFDFFKANYEDNFVHEDGQAGTFFLHPNAAGITKLSEYWANAIQSVVK